MPDLLSLNMAGEEGAHVLRKRLQPLQGMAFVPGVKREWLRRPVRHPGFPCANQTALA